MGVLIIVHFIGQGVYEGLWGGAHEEQRRGQWKKWPSGDVPEKRLAQEVALASAPIRQC